MSNCVIWNTFHLFHLHNPLGGRRSPFAEIRSSLIEFRVESGKIIFFLDES